MGLLSQIVGGVLGGAGGGGSPLESVLTNMLAGGQQAGTGPGGGGLGGLVSSFERAGLGNVVQSWIGTGPNEPVSPQQLQNVFGHDRVQAMAGQAGMAPHDFLSQLSQHLPKVVDGMTPNGRLPDEGTVSV
jgi:uncharacterized protein YidB (DUF937 family)